MVIKYSGIQFWRNVSLKLLKPWDRNNLTVVEIFDPHLEISGRSVVWRTSPDSEEDCFQSTVDQNSVLFTVWNCSKDKYNNFTVDLGKSFVGINFQSHYNSEWKSEYRCFFDNCANSFYWWRSHDTIKSSKTATEWNLWCNCFVRILVCLDTNQYVFSAPFQQSESQLDIWPIAILNEAVMLGPLWHIQFKECGLLSNPQPKCQKIFIFLFRWKKNDNILDIIGSKTLKHSTFSLWFKNVCKHQQIIRRNHFLFYCFIARN